jgi:hypothetical protein
MKHEPVDKPFRAIDKKAWSPHGGGLDNSSIVMAEQVTPRQLVWSARNPDDWEILIYKCGELWEACFFRWAIHHEHAMGSSFDSVLRRVEQRIHILEAGHLKLTEWRQVLH